MRAPIQRSIFLAFLAVFLIAALAAVLLLTLNERFVDSALLGWVAFLVVPALIAIPITLLAALTGLACRGGANHHATCFFRFLLVLTLVPIGGFISYTSLHQLLEDSPGAVISATVLVLLIFILGCWSLAGHLTRLSFKEGSPRWGVVGLLVLVLVAIPPFGSWLSRRPVSWARVPTLVFGIDGATWRIIDRLTGRNELPAFQMLQREGTRFDLRSSDQQPSPVLWTTIGSGVGPSEHGVTSFWATSADVRAPRLWDMVSQHRHSVGLLGWPVTWPPRQVEGFLIPSLFARGTETFPANLQFIRELTVREKTRKARDLGDYLFYTVRCIQNGVKLSTLLDAAQVLLWPGDRLRAYSTKRFLKVRIHGDVFSELLQRYQPDFAAFYNNIPDAISHSAWKYYEPEAFGDVAPEEIEEFGDLIPEAYRRYDAEMVKILQTVPKDANVVVVSDHGLKAAPVGLRKVYRRILTEELIDALELADELQGFNLLSKVFLGSKRSPEKFPEELRQLIDGVVVEETSEPVFRTRLDDLGNLVVSARPEPDLDNRHLLFTNGKRVEARQIVLVSRARKSGAHSTDAILLLKGKPLRKGEQGGEATLLDVAPTVLHLMGLPVGEKMEGQILQSAFQERFLRANPVSTQEYTLLAGRPTNVTDENVDNLKETLRSLGYLE